MSQETTQHIIETLNTKQIDSLILSLFPHISNKCKRILIGKIYNRLECSCIYTDVLQYCEHCDTLYCSTCHEKCNNCLFDIV